MNIKGSTRRGGSTGNGTGKPSWQDVRRSAPYASLQRKLERHDALAARVAAAFPEPWRIHVRFGGLEHGCLTLLVPSSAWATRLRTWQTRVLEDVRSTGLDAHTLRLRVVAEQTPLRQPERQQGPRHISRTSANYLRHAAGSVSDPHLRDLFLELADLAGDSGDEPEG